MLGPDDLRGREAGIVDGERHGVAHHLEGQVTASDEPRTERRHPGDRLLFAQPCECRMRAMLELGQRHAGTDRRRAGHAADDRLPAMATTATERKLLIDGEWVETGDWLEVASPYDGSPVARVAKAGAAETRRALDAAERAMESPLPAHKRAEILVRVAGALGRRADEAARQISAEAGKPLKAARVEASRAMSTYTFAAVEARKLAGEMVPMDASQAGEGKLAFTLRRPIGVVGAISPFNFPLNLVAHKIAPALAAGCAVVLKPASQTPLSALLLAELEHEAGLPPGWLNVVVGPSSEIGDVLVEDERVKLITFTGSGDVGWGIRARAPKKKVGLELGNATPVIVEADADVEDAATTLRRERVLLRRPELHLGAADLRAARRLRRLQGALRAEGGGAQGRRPGEEDTDVGPLISLDERDRVVEWIEQARDGGATILTGGELEGDLLRPTVVEEPAADAHLACDEAFGPVCTLQPYDTLDEAIALANATRYGLQAGIFTASLASALKAAGPPRVRRRHRQRGADVPRRPDAVRRRQGVGQHARGPGLGRARDDRRAPRRHPALRGTRLRAVSDTRRPPATARAILTAMALFSKKPPAPAASDLRRERRALLLLREERLRDLGGLTLEMYRRDHFNEALVVERCAELVAIEARASEIDALLAGARGLRRRGGAICACGAPVLTGARFCPSCGTSLIDEPGLRGPPRPRPQGHELPAMPRRRRGGPGVLPRVRAAAPGTRAPGPPTLRPEAHRDSARTDRRRRDRRRGACDPFTRDASAPGAVVTAIGGSLTVTVANG